MTRSESGDSGVVAGRRSRTYTVAEAPLAAILSLRDAYRREMACQIVHDSWHERGFTRSYLITFGGKPVGYGSVGGGPRDPKQTVKEFFLLPEHRHVAYDLFAEVARSSGARKVEAQTNDRLLFLLALDFAGDLTWPTILFADGLLTAHAPDGAVLRPLLPDERARVFRHVVEPVGDHCVEIDGAVIATGGLMFHYNAPYADIYMEVAEPHRGRGIGRFLVQELKRAAYRGGHVPAARCDATNVASRRTLESAGMFPCARIVQGSLPP